MGKNDGLELVVSVDSLPVMNVGLAGSIAQIFHGADHDLAPVSLMLGYLQPGEGPSWHQHTYDEIFMIEEGEARFTIGEEQFCLDRRQDRDRACRGSACIREYRHLRPADGRDSHGGESGYRMVGATEIIVEFATRVADSFDAEGDGIGCESD